MPICGWHEGEVAAQEARGYGELYGEHHVIQNDFPPNHRAFYPSLNFLPLATLDVNGRPWISLLTAKEGKRGFCETVLESDRNVDESATELKMRVWLGQDDPARHNLAHGQMLAGERKVAGVGVELLNRRRNKFAGHVEQSFFATKDPDECDIIVTIENVIGNCPKYINSRVLVPSPSRCQPMLVASSAATKSLVSAAISIIRTADLIFLATVYQSTTKNESRDPSRLGANLRGGRPGFVRVIQNDPDEGGASVIYIPDFSGNRFMQSIGNIQSSSRAGLAIPSFGVANISSPTQGSRTNMLYLTGDAKVLYGTAASSQMRSAKAVIRLVVREWKLVNDAIPLVNEDPSRIPDQPGISIKDQREPVVAWSAYNPPIWPVRAEEAAQVSSWLSGLPSNPTSTSVNARLTNYVPHTSTLGTFTFTVSRPLILAPGQHIVLDANSLLSARIKHTYSHMGVPSRAHELNDAGVRTYTVSPFNSSFDGSPINKISITLRLIRAGGVTPTIFYRGDMFLGQLSDGISPDELKFVPELSVLGVEGDFILPPPAPCRLLYLMNGVGITPFLAHLAELVHRAISLDGTTHIYVVLAARVDEVEVMRGLVEKELEAQYTSQATTLQNPVLGRLDIQLHIVSPSSLEGSPHTPTDIQIGTHVSLSVEFHYGQRLGSSSLVFPASSSLPTELNLGSSLHEPSSYTRVFICGTPAFAQIAKEAVREAGIQDEIVKLESFTY